MKAARRLAAALATLALLLPLAGCGKYGKPVRKSRAALGADVGEGQRVARYQPAGTPQLRIRDAQEKKPGAR